MFKIQSFSEWKVIKIRSEKCSLTLLIRDQHFAAMAQFVLVSNHTGPVGSFRVLRKVLKKDCTIKLQIDMQKFEYDY